MVGIVCGILIMVLMAVKRWNAILCSLVAAIVVGLLNGMGFWNCLLEVFMPAVGSILASFMMMFLCSALYARLILDSGSASAVAGFIFRKCGKKRVVLAVFLTTCLLTYGGINAFVIFFLLWPICLKLAKDADIPKTIFFPTIYAGCLGGFALAMPGSPQTANVIAAEMLQTTAYAAPVSSILATIAMTLFSCWYLNRLQKRYERKGMHFVAPAGSGPEEEEKQDLPSFTMAVLPMACTVVLYILLTNGILGTSMSSIPAICTAQLLMSVVVILLNWKRFGNLKASIGKGAAESISPLMSLSVVMAFATVVQSTTAFTNFVETIQNMGGSPLVQMILVANIIGLITASASGTVRFVLTSFGPYWLTMGVNAQVLTRVMVLSSCMLSYAPHSGGFFASLDVAQETHSTVYLDSFILAAGGAVIGVVVVIGCYYLGIV